MGNALDGYRQVDFNLQLARLLEWMPIGFSPSLHPRACLLGGQSGAGKTRLHRVIRDRENDDYIIINGDEYRKLHPHFNAIQAQYGIDASAHTAPWSGAMAEALIDALSLQGYNLIIEGTLRTSSVPLKTARLLRERGYSVSLAVMAVKPEISLVSCKIRYEMMRLAGTTPRAVDPAYHQAIARDIVENLAVLEASDAFDSVALYDRAGDELFKTACPTHGYPASTALSDILYGSWSSQERMHLANLGSRLAALEEAVKKG